MTKNLKSVLLVDDDEATNFIHELIIKKHGIIENITFKTDGEKAIEWLNETIEKEKQVPDIIFLDINMPHCNGWEFLDRYKELDKNQRDKIEVVMLTTSLNLYDREKAESLEDVSEFRSKPLTIEILDEIKEKYFKK